MARRRLLLSIAALTLASGLVFPSISYADQLSTYQQKEKHLKEQQDQTKQQIQALTAQESSLRDQISRIQSDIKNLQGSIITTQAEMMKRAQKIAELKKRIEQTQKEINQEYAILKQRIQVMYEDGQTSYLAVLLSATSFSDLLDRLQSLSIIAQDDQKVLKGIQANQQALTVADKSLKTQQAAEQKVYKSLLQKQSQQQSMQAHEVTLLGQVHDKKLSQQADLNSENTAMQNLKTLIQQLESQEGGYTGAASGWTWPLPGYTDITSPYGWRTWSDGTKEFHDGIDIGAPIGAKMVSVTNGKVLYAGPASGFGDWIVIESAGGLLEIYGHMYAYEIKVSPGEIVHEGQQIASVGNNGDSTGPHLHITIATGFDSSGFPISINPMKYL